MKRKQADLRAYVRKKEQYNNGIDRRYSLRIHKSKTTNAKRANNTDKTKHGLQQKEILMVREAVRTIVEKVITEDKTFFSLKKNGN